jgi:small subunit ribosomal protein S9
MPDKENIIPVKDKPAKVIWGTGRRKCAIARVRIKPGTGLIQVNGALPENFFYRQAQISGALLPLVVTEREKHYDIIINVHGGGIAGQADAVKLGIARALEKVEPNLRPALKDAGCLTRDARVKESKKYGQKRARKKFQFSKR